VIPNQTKKKEKLLELAKMSNHLQNKRDGNTPDLALLQEEKEAELGVDPEVDPDLDLGLNGGVGGVEVEVEVRAGPENLVGRVDPGVEAPIVRDDPREVEVDPEKGKIKNQDLKADLEVGVVVLVDETRKATKQAQDLDLRASKEKL